MAISQRNSPHLIGRKPDERVIRMGMLQVEKTMACGSRAPCLSPTVIGKPSVSTQGSVESQLGLGLKPIASLLGG